MILSAEARKILRNILLAYSDRPNTSLGAFHIWFAICSEMLFKLERQDVIDMFNELIDSSANLDESTPKYVKPYSMGIPLDNTSDAYWNQFLSFLKDLYDNLAKFPGEDVELDASSIQFIASKFCLSDVRKLDIQYKPLVEFVEKHVIESVPLINPGQPANTIPFNTGNQNSLNLLLQMMQNRKSPAKRSDMLVPAGSDTEESRSLELSDIGNIDKAYIREVDLDRLISNINNKSKRGVILHGESGSGKRHLIHSFMSYLNNLDEGSELHGYTVIPMNIPRLIASPKNGGDLAQFIDSLEADAKKIFVIEHTLYSSMMSMLENSANPLLRIIESNNVNSKSKVVILADNKVLSNISASFRNSLNSYIEQKLDPPSGDDLDTILQLQRVLVSEKYGVFIEDEVFEGVVNLTKDNSSPKKFMVDVINILDDICMLINSDSDISTEEIVTDVVSEYFGITFNLDINNRYLDLEEELSKDIYNQDESINSVAKTIRISKALLRDPGKPVGVFLLLGGTGTGKTLLAERLAEYMFGDDGLVRINMNEYQEAYSTSRLIGAAPGLVGYDEGSYLINKLAENKARVILLDEIEKAHPSVIHFFLQILDKGVFVSGNGKEIDITKSVIVMTSNLGSEMLFGSGVKGFSSQTDDSAVKEDIKQMLVSPSSPLSPEFVNRIDSICIFNKLDRNALRLIIDRRVSDIVDRMSSNGVNISLHLTDSVYNYLLDRDDYDSNMGAREVIRAVDRELTSSIADLILANKGIKSIIARIKDGNIFVEES